MKGVKNLTGLPREASVKWGFTLIELLVVILVVGVLATLATTSLKVVRISGRDARRISDVAQIQRALEIYKNDNGIYPAGADFVVGEPLVSPDGSITYFKKIPANPLPDDGSGCSVAEYTYGQVDGGASYRLQFCLGKAAGSVGPNNVEALPNTLNSVADAPAAVCGNNTLEGAEVCDHTGVTPECELMPGYYPLNAGVPACDGRQACKSDCTECPVGECNGAQ